MDEKKLKEDITAIVKTIFDSKEEAEKRKKTEDALQESATLLDTLTSAMTAKEKEVEDLKSDLEKAEAELKEVKESKVDDKELEDVKAALESAKESEESLKAKIKELEEVSTNALAELDAIKTEAMISKRTEELASEGVLRQDSEAQVNRLKEMDDAAFKEYKEELISIKASIIEKLKETNKNYKSKDHDSKINTEQAALNLEVASTDLKKTYSDLGNALADLIK